MSLDRPIFVIGPARSGTTLLGNLLARHPQVAVWLEPKFIWRYRGAFADSDVRIAAEATPPVARYIRRRFARHAERAGRPRFAEKTPSNCLRVPFIDRIFPDGRFLCIERHGYDVALSAYRKWTQPSSKQALWRRATSFEIPLRDTPAYVADFVREVVGRELDPGRGLIWGPHIPDLRRIRREHDILETCAIQWRECARALREEIVRVPEERRLTVRYEAFTAAPGETLERILEFLQLDADPALIEHARSAIRTDSVGKWRRVRPERLARLRPLLGPMLEDLGYEDGI